jgi:hypothetical protein
MYSLSAWALTYTPTHDYRIYHSLIFFSIPKEKRPLNLPVSTIDRMDSSALSIFIEDQGKYRIAITTDIYNDSREI